MVFGKYYRKWKSLWTNFKGLIPERWKIFKFIPELLKKVASLALKSKKMLLGSSVVITVKPHAPRISLTILDGTLWNNRYCYAKPRQ